MPFIACSTTPSSPSTPSSPIKTIAMTKEITEEQAFSKLSALCARAEHCRQEMAEKMRRWQLPADVQERVINRLIDGRFIDDERYCRAFVHDKLQYAKWGRRKIEQALYMKRIPEGVVARVFDEIEPSAYVETLRRVLEAKAKSVKADSRAELKAKLMRFAYGRGYSADDALPIIEDLLQE